MPIHPLSIFRDPWLRPCAWLCRDATGLRLLLGMAEHPDQAVRILAAARSLVPDHPPLQPTGPGIRASLSLGIPEQAPATPMWDRPLVGDAVLHAVLRCLPHGGPTHLPDRVAVMAWAEEGLPSLYLDALDVSEAFAAHGFDLGAVPLPAANLGNTNLFTGVVVRGYHAGLGPHRLRARIPISGIADFNAFLEKAGCGDLLEVLPGPGAMPRVIYHHPLSETRDLPVVRRRTVDGVLPLVNLDPLEWDWEEVLG